jgi:hypothetical protein
MSAIRTTIAGIAIPNSALARETTEFVRDASTPLRTGAPLADGVMNRRLPLFAETERLSGSAVREARTSLLAGASLSLIYWSRFSVALGHRETP